MPLGGGERGEEGEVGRTAENGSLTRVATCPGCSSVAIATDGMAVQAVVTVLCACREWPAS